MTKEPKVWVIDDDRSIRWVLERALRKAEMHVTCFSNGVGVMEALEREQPDAILSDIRMPGIDGLGPPAPDHRSLSGPARHHHDRALGSG